jgi:hypothetical protein
MSDIPNIAPHTDLKPKKKYFEEVGDTCINVDGCIELAKQIDTPQARAIYRAYRKRLATNPQGVLSAEKHREQAFFDGLHDLGIRTPMTPINGNME